MYVDNAQVRGTEVTGCGDCTHLSEDAVCTEGFPHFVRGTLYATIRTYMHKGHA